MFSTKRYTCRYSEAAQKISYPSIEPSMRRWRRHNVPSIPNNLDEYVAFMEDPRWVRYSNYVQGGFFKTILRGDDESVSVIFGNTEFIVSVMLQLFMLMLYLRWSYMLPALNFVRKQI